MPNSCLNKIQGERRIVFKGLTRSSCLPAAFDFFDFSIRAALVVWSMVIGGLIDWSIRIFCVLFVEISDEGMDCYRRSCEQKTERKTKKNEDHKPKSDRIFIDFESEQM